MSYWWLLLLIPLQISSNLLVKVLLNKQLSWSYLDAPPPSSDGGFCFSALLLALPNRFEIPLDGYHKRRRLWIVGFKQEMAYLLSLYMPRYNLDTRYYFSYMRLAFYVYLFRDNVWWFEQECPPPWTRVFEWLVSSRWHCLGRIGRCDPTGGGVSLGVSFVWCFKSPCHSELLHALCPVLVGQI